MQVAFEALAEENGGGYLPMNLIKDLHDQNFAASRKTTCSNSDDRKAEAAKATAIAATNQILKLYGSIFRTSLRK